MEGKVPVWRLSPTARPDDPHWLDHTYKKPLLVRAQSPADARFKAAAWDRQGIAECLGNESPADRSAFGDAKLYEVTELADGCEGSTNIPLI